MKIKPAINIYKDFLKDYQHLNPWTSADCLPRDDIKKENYNYVAIELKYPGTQGNNDLYESALRPFDDSMTSYLDTVSGQFITMFRLENVCLISRIRSYKGFLKELLKAHKDKINFIEKEFKLDEHYSVFAGLIRIDKDIFELVGGYLFFRERNCLLVTDEDLFNLRFLEYFLESFINKKSFVIDYFKLGREICKNKDFIIREMGDGGDREFTWQMFVDKQNLPKVLKTLENLDLA